MVKSPTTFGVCAPDQCSVSDVTQILNLTSLFIQQKFNSRFIFFVKFNNNAI